MEGLKRLRKRTLALFMALTLCLSLVQVTAYAEDGMPDGGELPPAEETVCEHEWSKYIVTRAATCTETGEETLACAKCDLLITEIENPEEIEGYEDLTLTQEIPALDHTWGEWMETFAATEEAEGEEVRICAVCQAEETRTTEKLAPAPEIESAPVQSAPAFAGADNGISPTAEDENEPALITTEEQLRAAVTAGGEVKLGSDITLNSTLVIDKTVTLDLAGYTLSQSVANISVIKVTGEGTVFTLNDSGEDGTITVTVVGVPDYGGGVFVTDGAEFIMTGGTIKGCRARNGGGVMVDKGCIFTMTGGTISDNVSFFQGVGSFGESSTFIMTGGEISNNGADGGYGNDICADPDNKWQSAIPLQGGGVYTEGTARIEGGTISNNLAKDGGGVYVACGSFTLSGGAISGNTADANGNSSYGGGVYATGNATFDMSSGSISGNEASYGGGVYMDGGTFNMTGGDVSSNIAPKPKNDGHGCSGAGVFMKGGAFTMSNSTISGNHATGMTSSVGGVSLNNGARFTMESGSITGNTADRHQGGGVLVGGNCSFIMESGTINGNECRDGGGGVSVNGGSGASFLMKGGTISGNTVNNGLAMGGGVSVLSGKFTMENGTIENNTAINNGDPDSPYESEHAPQLGLGGGVSVAVNGTFTMKNGVIRGNTITGKPSGITGGGGGVAVIMGSSFTMENGTITGNTAKANEGEAAPYSGGGVYVDSSTFTRSRGVLCNNTAETAGADVFAAGATVTLGDISNEGWKLTVGDAGHHKITGWFQDTADTRWACDAPTAEHTTYDAQTAPAGGLFLKAAHGILCKLTVKYVNEQGEEISSTVIEQDKGSQYTVTPKAPDGYEIKEIQGDTSGTLDENKEIVVICYQPKVTVTWLNGYDGTAVKTKDDHEKGAAVDPSDYPANPTRPGYTFTGWGDPVTDGDGNITITAQWRLNNGGGTIDFPDPTPTPRPTPVPDEPTPTDPGTDIGDEATPLAGAVGLNDVDHFAYIVGYDDGTVRPTANITRAEVATIFFRLMEDDFRAANWSTENSFSDVSVGQWYNNAISTCAKAGALTGYGDGSFKPENPITRAEFAVIASRFLSDEYTDEGVGDFSDTANHWAAKEIRRAVKAGWITGDGNKFRPEDPITRAEVMTIVNRMLDRLPDAEHLLPDMIHWPDNPEGTWYYEAVQEATNEHDYERDELNAEIWTLLKPHRDWSALEKEWADAYAG